jgi:hypothetical protein
MHFFFSFFFFAGIHVFGWTWNVPDNNDWQVINDAGDPVLVLQTGREPPSSLPRRPVQFAVAETPPFSGVRIEADVEPFARSLLIVFAYKDSAHFDYAHLSIDAASKEPHHNGIFHVYGGERVRISPDTGPAAFAATRRWYHVVLTHSGATGEVSVSVDGRPVPSLHAVDLSLTAGRIGLGSFDETAEFKSVRVSPVK